MILKIPLAVNSLKRKQNLMNQAEQTQLKELVKEKYSQIAEQSKTINETSCCGAGGCGSPLDYTVMADDYTKLEGYVADADLGLGCGLPTQHALIKAGHTVVDLGSGAGNDCFVARSLTGKSPTSTISDTLK